MSFYIPGPLNLPAGGPLLLGGGPFDLPLSVNAEKVQCYLRFKYLLSMISTSQFI
jgi:hypothetical protein